MRLDLREVIHTPGAVKAFAFPLDLSQLEFYGQFPIVRPVEVEGRVVNHAGRTAPGWHEQRALLEQEGVKFKKNGHVDMARYQWDP